MSKRKNKIACDLDDSLINVSDNGGDWEKGTPIQDRIDVINKLYDLGWKIIIWSSREKDEREETEEQLEKFGIKYSKLKLNKPKFQLLLDNRAWNISTFFSQFEDDKGNVNIDEVEDFLENYDFDRI